MRDWYMNNRSCYEIEQIYPKELVRYKGSENVYCRYQGSYAKYDTMVTEEFQVSPDRHWKVELIGVIDKRSQVIKTYEYHGTILMVKFCMPAHDVIIKITEKETIMDPNSKQVLVDRFEIPDELARELSELLTKQTIRERLLTQLIDDQDKYNKVEDMLIPVTARIEAIKLKITKEYVPSLYDSTRYIWNYDGYEIDGNRLQIIDLDPVH